MYSARWSIRAVALLFVSGLCSFPAHAQAVQFLSFEAKSLRLASLRDAKPCSAASILSASALPGGSPNSGTSPASCDDAPTPVMPTALCTLSRPPAAGCAPSADPVRDDLNTMGKPGQKVLQAREKVLEILQSENACTDWYRTKDPDPAATFGTVTFALDRNGEAYVRKANLPGGIELLRSPYAARVLQGAGPRSTVTINMNGAFFFPLTSVVEEGLDGGPRMPVGSRVLHVGPYGGGTQRARVLTLLHEFGHVIDLLPPDPDDYEGRSRQNTLEVLRACRAEIEAKDAPRTLLATR